MIQFRDAFTGVVYEMGKQWIAAVRQAVAEAISPSLQSDDLREAADATACFWRDTYYRRLFPLRFGLQQSDTGLYSASGLFPEAPQVDLEALAGQPLRTDFLDGVHLPPLLPAAEEGETTELLADRLLTQTALANLLLRQTDTNEDTLHAVRLACLTYPLLDLLEERLRASPRVVEVARFLRQESPTPPSGLDPALMTALRDMTDFGERKVWLGLVAAQRVKRYVFETSGLNEIRGASTLLDDLTEDAKEALSQALGPEIVLRAVGSTVMFLAPTKNVAGEWAERLRQAFYEATGMAFTAAATTEVSIGELLDDYKGAVSGLFQALAEDRAQADQPLYEALPFEARCQMCRLRPAEGWVRDVPGEEEPVPFCRVCRTKRECGQPEREGKAQQVLDWLSLKQPKALGVQGTTPSQYVAQALGRADPEEKGFIPREVRRPLLATVYGDGNNFGAVGQKLTEIAMGLQWSQRVEKTTRAAAAIALARATQQTAIDRGWKPGQDPVLPKLPFQVLALGGDDLSLFAWAPVGLRFARDFVELTNLEFHVPEGASERLIKQPIAFSLGILLTDYKAAVRRTVEVAEEDLMKWAKRAFRESELKEGNVAMLLAMSQEQIPDNLDLYRKRMYLNRGALLDLCLTLRPFTADELAWLVKQAKELREQSGPLHRLVAPFVQSGPLVALLHYIYQRGRFDDQKDHWLRTLESQERPASLVGLHYPAAPRSQLNNRKLFGLESKKDKRLIWITPLWDLLELVKVLE